MQLEIFLDLLEGGCRILTDGDEVHLLFHYTDLSVIVDVA
jgi:hypothetical protein